IGHPTFGHAGEMRLHELMRDYGDRFDHNLHALRIVEQFEQRYLDFPGLNLTFEVREGIVKHSRDYPPADFRELAEYQLDLQPPIEAQLMNAVDEIAYNSADLDDGFEARLLEIDMLRVELPFFTDVYDEVDRTHPGGRTKVPIVEERDRSVNALEQLLRFYLAHPTSLPKYYSELTAREAPHRVVCDYIAGMTDHFLLRQHRELVGMTASI